MTRFSYLREAVKVVNETLRMTGSTVPREFFKEVVMDTAEEIEKYETITGIAKFREVYNV